LLFDVFWHFCLRCSFTVFKYALVRYSTRNTKLHPNLLPAALAVLGRTAN
jgi:hypothetical protein